MTCEFCGKSRTDVDIYDCRPIGIKVNLCTPCTRKIDFIEEEIRQKYITELKKVILPMIITGE